MPLGDGPRGGPLFNPKSAKYGPDGRFGRSVLVRGMQLDPCSPTVLTHLPRVFDDVPGTSSSPAPPGGLNVSEAHIGEPLTAAGRRFGQPPQQRGGRVEARFTGLVASASASSSSRRGAQKEKQEEQQEADDFEVSSSSPSSAPAAAGAEEEEAKLPHGYGVLEGVVYDHAGRAVATHVLRCGDWSHGVADGRASERVTRLDPSTGDVLEVDYREGVFDRGVRARGFEATDVIRRGGGGGRSPSPAQPSLSGGATPRSRSPHQSAPDGHQVVAAAQHGVSARSVLGGRLDADDDDPMATMAYRGPGDALRGERLPAARATSDLLQILSAAEHGGAGGSTARGSPTPKPTSAGGADPFRTLSSTPHGHGRLSSRAPSAQSASGPHHQRSPYGAPLKPPPRTARASSRSRGPAPSAAARPAMSPVTARLPPRAPSSAGPRERPLSGRPAPRSSSSIAAAKAAGNHTPQAAPLGCSPRPPSALASAARQALRAVSHRDPLADLSGGNATPRQAQPQADVPPVARRTTLRSRSRYDGPSAEYQERMAQLAAEATEQAAEDAAVRHGRLLDAQWNSVVAGVIGYASDPADPSDPPQRTPRQHHQQDRAGRGPSASRRAQSGASASAGSPSSTAALMLSKGPFRLGQHVVVHTSRENIHGIVRYCGRRLDGRPGTIVGVETEVQHAGYHDGSVHGRTYFSCEPGHGILVPTSHVSSAFDSRPFEP